MSSPFGPLPLRTVAEKRHRVGLLAYHGVLPYAVHEGPSFLGPEVPVYRFLERIGRLPPP